MRNRASSRAAGPHAQSRTAADGAVRTHSGQIDEDDDQSPMNTRFPKRSRLIHSTATAERGRQAAPTTRVTRRAAVIGTQVSMASTTLSENDSGEARRRATATDAVASARRRRPRSSARATFAAGPAAPTRIMPRCGSLKRHGEIGTGRAQPKKKGRPSRGRERRACRCPTGRAGAAGSTRGGLARAPSGRRDAAAAQPWASS